MSPAETTAAATDVSEFITDLDGGQFERMLSIAISQVAAGVVDNKRVGEVSVKFHIDHIPGTSQVNLKHTLKFARPTADGKAGEEATRTTVLHVGKFGKLTLMPENQLKMFGNANTPTNA
ncbi:MAG: hypothetical protein RSD57_13555 [Comamonas sp.]